jgi:hypothetical protein
VSFIWDWQLWQYGVLLVCAQLLFVLDRVCLHLLVKQDNKDFMYVTLFGSCSNRLWVTRAAVVVGESLCLCAQAAV